MQEQKALCAVRNSRGKKVGRASVGKPSQRGGHERGLTLDGSGCGRRTSGGRACTDAGAAQPTGCSLGHEIGSTA